jgi:hypothetical protein
MVVKWVITSVITDSEKAYDPVRKEVFYNILIELNTPMNIVTLIKMRLTNPVNLMHFLFRMIRNKDILFNH